MKNFGFSDLIVVGQPLPQPAVLPAMDAFAAHAVEERGAGKPHRTIQGRSRRVADVRNQLSGDHEADLERAREEIDDIDASAMAGNFELTFAGMIPIGVYGFLDPGAFPDIMSLRQRGGCSDQCRA